MRGIQTVRCKGLRHSDPKLIDALRILSGGFNLSDRPEVLIAVPQKNKLIFDAVCLLPKQNERRIALGRTINARELL